MPRVDLRVHFTEKDEAKKRGARWDAVARLWYVPDGLDPALFAEWLVPEPSPTEPNIRCNRFYVATGLEPCWKCVAPSRVFSLVVPQGHDKRQPKGEPLEGRWLRYEHEAMLWRVTWLSDAAVAAMKEHTANYFLDESKGYLPTKFFNHCEHCGAKQREPGSAGGHVFQPETHEAAQRVTLHYYNRPMEASCHHDDMLTEYHFHGMKRADDAEAPEQALLRYLVE